MNALEQQLQYPLAETLPEPGRTLAVTPGVDWLRMPLPFALDHINLWLLRDRHEGRDGWTAIDCGIANDAIRERWERVFADELEGLPIVRVLVTHMHPDHLGLAHWLCERWDARLWMTAADYTLGTLLSRGLDSNAGGEGAAGHFARHGLTDADSLAKIRARGRYFPTLVPAVPPHYRRLMHGDSVAIGGHDWRVIAGYGHAPEHASFYCAALKLLISGDMVLPRISTNISVWDLEPEADPLGLYLNSLQAYDDLPGDVLVLPSHGKPFVGLHTRIAQLREHHAERLDETRAACREAPQSAADIVPRLFRRELDLHQLTFAMGEALAHLHYLWHTGELTRTRDAAGIYRFAVRP